MLKKLSDYVLQGFTRETTTMVFNPIGLHDSATKICRHSQQQVLINFIKQLNFWWNKIPNIGRLAKVDLGFDNL